MASISGALHIVTGLVCYIPLLFASDPVAYVGESQIKGQRIHQSNMEVNQYLGIPYAEPPVGDLRFQKTKPIGKLPSELRAVQQPPACPQYSKITWPWYINGTEKSEDCLFLNIWTPTDASPQNTKAVFYWVHGGGFRYGSIGDPIYSGIALAVKGDVVVVTVNYRIGPLGFFSSGTDDAPGNYGLWDQLEGLRWVNKNIKAFGGDPERITIAGESGGSVSIGLLTVSPLTKGLFARLILQSGSPTTNQTANEKNLRLAQQLATIVECADENYTINDHPAEITRCLKGIDAVTLSKADSMIEPFSTSGFRPQYGLDAIISQNPQVSIQKGDFHCTELFAGVNRYEGSLFVTTANPDVYGFFGQKNPKINKTEGIAMMRKIFAVNPNQDDIIKHYLKSKIAVDDYDAVRYQVCNAKGDTQTVCPVIYYAEKCAEKGKSYFYYYVHRPSISPWASWMGVTHYDEIQFVFGQPVLNPTKYKPEEKDISLNMILLWTNFVKNGKPSNQWPLYSKDNPVFGYVGLEKDMNDTGQGPRQDACNLLRPYFGF